MTKKIKGLTDVLLNRSYDNIDEKYINEIKGAYLALDNECYEQAWEHFYELYSVKNSDVTNPKYIRGQGAFGLCKVMQEIPDNHEFVKHLIETDADLVRKAKMRFVSSEYARKYIGRRYLVYSADDCGFYPAMVEYALNCVGKGPKKSFVFEFNDRDASVGYQWGIRLVNSDVSEYKAMGYMVQAITYFSKYLKTKEKEYGRDFCDKVLEAKKLVGEDNEYVSYFYAHICTDPKFAFYENGKHVDIKKGYQIFCRVIDEATDPDLIASSVNIKNALENKYPSKIGR